MPAIIRDPINTITAGQPGHQGTDVLSVYVTASEAKAILGSRLIAEADRQYPDRRIGAVVWIDEAENGGYELLFQDLGPKP